MDSHKHEMYFHEKIETKTENLSWLGEVKRQGSVLDDLREIGQVNECQDEPIRYDRA